MEPYFTQPMTARSAASRIKRSYGGRLTGRVFKRVFRRSKLSSHVEADEEEHSGFDILCVGDPPQAERPMIQPNPIIYPLKSGNKLAPRSDYHEPEVRSGRRKSSASDYMQNIFEEERVDKKRYDADDGVDSEEFSSTPTYYASRIARSRDSVGHLIAERSSNEARRPQIQGMERRSSRIQNQVVAQPTAESAARDYMRHRRHNATNSTLLRQHSRRSVQGNRLSIELSPAREEAMLLQIQNGKRRMSKEAPKSPCDLTLLKTRSEVIDRACPTASGVYVAQWDAYLTDYTEGRFNIITPPNPPRRHSSFTFLPALSPHNEEERMALLEKLNPQWSEAQLAEGMHMVTHARREFEASGAAISLVISDAEIVKVQEGYGWGAETIKRSQSFAAHALLSTEVLVILDTHEDWRFAGNPLVTQDPKIRFYAGAPMISSNGAVIGVFSIFGYEPRDDFSAMQRRRLTDFSTSAMSNIIPRTRKESATPSTRPSTPMVHGQPTPQASFDMAELPVHPAFREGFKLEDGFVFSSPRSLETPQFKDTIQIWNANVPTPGRPTPDLHFTPPNSSPEDGISPTDPGPGLGKNYKQLFLAMHHPNLTFRERLPDGIGIGNPVLRSWTPRPFSGSDLTSVEGRHPNTPSDAHFDGDVKRSMDTCEESYFDRSIVDPSFVYEHEKARMIVEHTASLDVAAFYRKDWPQPSSNAGEEEKDDAKEGDTERAGLYREASRPLLSYYEPPEERGRA